MCQRCEPRLQRCAANWWKRRWPKAAEFSFLTGPEPKEQDMNRISSFGRIAAGIVLAAGAAFTPGVARAQRLGNDTIALFPKNIGEVAYPNLKQARSQKCVQ